MQIEPYLDARSMMTFGVPKVLMDRLAEVHADIQRCKPTSEEISAWLKNGQRDDFPISAVAGRWQE